MSTPTGDFALAVTTCSLVSIFQKWGGVDMGCSKGAQFPVFWGEHLGPGPAHLAQGEQRGDGPEGELQHHQGGHPGPHDRQDQGQACQVRGLQRSPSGPKPLLFQPPLGVAVGAEWA